ncbi:Sphingolipid C9-methyltransferase 2 [Orbilia ellipsospora]|uniref:sphingolipid C(9)-methyltransferase n=2 Tax=Orbilia ellipsospora TaxID=2528407 RepID=A0AAV9XEA1_9PEZI
MSSEKPITAETFQYIKTPDAPPPPPESTACGVRTTGYPSIKNAPLPAEGPGSGSFNNLLLAGTLFVVPYYFKYKTGGGFWTFLFFAAITTVPILVGFWSTLSRIGARINEKAKLPGRGVEHYLEFTNPEDAAKYTGQNKIPMETFHEMYFEGKVKFKGDCLEAMEMRHDWASWGFTISLFRFFLLGFLPEILVHSRSQDEEQVRDHYDRGDDFYAWFLGPRMIYTSGIISDINKAESLEQLQDNKLKIVCEKIGVKPGDRMLDIGCGWGTLAKYASVNYGAEVTGITLGRNQTKWGNDGLRRAGIPEEQSRILCMDYRDIPVPEGGYKVITCLEMAEHVGVKYFTSFLRQVYGMLDDNGCFLLQIAGLRKSWQFEDLIWGLFMNKYIFPGADASTPLGFFVSSLESAGFEVWHIDTHGVHYSTTLWHWYRNWMANAEKVKAKYGERWFKIWEYFLAYSIIISRQGGATVYQITLHKNLNAYHRVDDIPRHYGFKGALEAPHSGFVETWTTTGKKQ